MSTRKGKAKERELARALREFGWTVERVTGSGGFSGTRSADLIFLPYEISEDLRIDDYLAENEEARNDLRTVEVKYKKDAGGVKTLYHEHLLDCGLGTNRALTWMADHHFMTGGLLAFMHQIANGRPDYHVTDKSLPNAVADILSGERDKTAPDYVAFRGSDRGWPLPWVISWEVQQ